MRDVNVTLGGKVYKGKLPYHGRVLALLPRADHDSSALTVAAAMLGSTVPLLTVEPFNGDVYVFGEACVEALLERGISQKEILEEGYRLLRMGFERLPKMECMEAAEAFSEAQEDSSTTA